MIIQVLVSVEVLEHPYGEGEVVPAMAEADEWVYRFKDAQEAVAWLRKTGLADAGKAAEVSSGIDKAAAKVAAEVKARGGK
jgi:hypothetical protein